MANVGSDIGPGFRDGLEANARTADGFYDFEQIARGVGQPIEFSDSNDIAFTKLVKHAVQFRPITSRRI